MSLFNREPPVPDPVECAQNLGVFVQSVMSEKSRVFRNGNTVNVGDVDRYAQTSGCVARLMLQASGDIAADCYNCGVAMLAMPDGDVLKKTPRAS